METTIGIYGVIGDLGILVITFGIMIGIVHMAERLGITINLRQGTYHDVKFHKQDNRSPEQKKLDKQHDDEYRQRKRDEKKRGGDNK